MKSYKLDLFKFLGAPVKLDLFFFALFIFLQVEAVIAVFISILIHEMAHAWIARRKGYNVYGIEIGLFQGSAAIDSNMHQRDSIPITFAGPLSNLLLYSLSMSLIFIFGDIYFLNILSLINIILFIFNMLPIFPMDGGIILRDILMLKIDRRKGARISAWISMTTSVMLFIFSLIFGFIIMSLFSIYFIYSSYKILKK